VPGRQPPAPTTRPHAGAGRPEHLECPLNTPPSTLDARPTSVDGVRLRDLVALVPDVVPAGVPGADPTITGLSLDSQAARPGDLYAALAGSRTHGARYAKAAVAAGAVAVLTDPDGAQLLSPDAPGVPVLTAPRPRAALGVLGAAVYGRPAERLLMLGVTGTQGKTTVTYLLEAGLRGAGHVPGLVGTTGSVAAGRRIASRLTTPEAPDLHALLAVMREQRVGACALEVSSHALVQGRVDGIVFDVACFLNLGRDHLDLHRDVESYWAAKAELFVSGRARRAVIDVGDEWGRRLARRTDLPHVTCSTDPESTADWRVSGVRLTARGSVFDVLGPAGRRQPVLLPIPGAFNVRNALAAVATLAEAGLPLPGVAAGLAGVEGAPGRMQVIDEGQGFAAVVDYAHTPEAVEAVLSTLRAATAGRLVLVLGAGGDRDPGKRPMMGRVAAELADVVVVTDDNPRTEDPAAIRAALLAGADESASHAQLVEQGDRAAAIRHAVAFAGEGDTVVVAGKGHETGQEVRGTIHPFDDRAVLRQVLRAALRERGQDG